MNKHTMTLTAASALLASLALAGCNQRDAGQTARNDENPTHVAQSQPSAGDRMAQDARNAGQAARDTAGDMANATRNAADQATNKVSDAVITTSVNAELAKDPKLSALNIDVDTSGGRVALKGTAPDQASKAHATQLAQGVKGVVSVDNQLTVGHSG